MSLFELLFGPKPELQPVSFSSWEDTAPPEVEPGVVAHTLFGKPVTESEPAAWPFPSSTTHTIQTVHGGVTVTEEAHDTDVPQLIVNVDKISAYHAEQAAWRRAEKARLKEIVQAAPEHGIEFVHIGTTTFAWRYHTAPEESGFIHHPLVIDISSAICNPTDQFAKWHGSAVAAERMIEGEYITLRIASDYGSPREALIEMGLPTLEEDERRVVRNDQAAKQWARIDARANAQCKQPLS